MPSDSYTDCIVIGAGLVGLSTAYQLARRLPGLRIRVLEKERTVALHQSGRNSGVIHAGLYYKPGSLKARACLAGRAELLEFCEAHNVPVDLCGKVVVATDEREVDALGELQRRASLNGIATTRLDVAALREIEPESAGLAALHVPSTGIIDYRQVAEQLKTLLVADGHSVSASSKVAKITETPASARILCEGGQRWEGGFFINCAGLHSDRVGRLCGVARDVIICPFRGEYYRLSGRAQALCRHLIYPVPDARYPFLGVHFTRTVHGYVECGPNAVLAMGREAYARGQMSLPDVMRTSMFPGFWRFASQHWRRGVRESWQSWRKPAFVAAARRLLPRIKAEDLVAGSAGIRAQALTRDGSLVDDFLIETSLSGIHVLNAPSPAATACLSLGRHVTDIALSKFEHRSALVRQVTSSGMSEASNAQRLESAI